MQTFLPYKKFSKSAQSLDWRRLGKQRVENMQIMAALAVGMGGPSRVNHTCTRMWRDHEWLLLAYQRAIIDEWLRREYIDTCWGKTLDYYCLIPVRQLPNRNPPWLGNRVFHLSYQSLLIRKQPEHYAPLFPGVSPDIPFNWPVPRYS